MTIISNAPLCEETNHIRLLLLHFGHAKVGKEWQGSNTALGTSRLYYIINGEAEACPKDSAPVRLTRGNWYLFPAGCSFDFSCPSHMEQLYFHLKLCDLDGRDLLSALPTPAVLTSEGCAHDFFLHCTQSHALSDGLLLRHTVEGLLFSFLREYGVTVENNQFSPCVVRAIKYIKQNLSAQLTVSEIAEHAFVSTSTLTKRFKAELSKSVGEYINDIIMFEAGQRLLKSDLSILAISEKYGFSDQFYFSKRFKEKFGLSPMKYRKTAIM